MDKNKFEKILKILDFYTQRYNTQVFQKIPEVFGFIYMVNGIQTIEQIPLKYIIQKLKKEYEGEVEGLKLEQKKILQEKYPQLLTKRYRITNEEENQKFYSMVESIPQKGFPISRDNSLLKRIYYFRHEEYERNVEYRDKLIAIWNNLSIREKENFIFNKKATKNEIIFYIKHDKNNKFFHLVGKEEIDTIFIKRLENEYFKYRKENNYLSLYKNIQKQPIIIKWIEELSILQNLKNNLSITEKEYINSLISRISKFDPDITSFYYKNKKYYEYKNIKDKIFYSMGYSSKSIHFASDFTFEKYCEFLELSLKSMKQKHQDILSEYINSIRIEEDPLTLEKLAEKYNLTKERIRQVKNKLFNECFKIVNEKYMGVK